MLATGHGGEPVSVVGIRRRRQRRLILIAVMDRGDLAALILGIEAIADAFVSQRADRGEAVSVVGEPSNPNRTVTRTSSPLLVLVGSQGSLQTDLVTDREAS